MPTNGAIFNAPVIDGDTVWAALTALGDIAQISARTNKIIKKVHVGDFTVAWPLGIVGGSLWAGSYDPRMQKAQLHRIVRKTAKVARQSVASQDRKGPCSAAISG